MKTFLFRLPSLLILAFLFLSPSTIQARTKPDKVDEYIETQMRRQKIPGLSIAVMKDGKVIKERGYGLANIETGTPATEKTVYKIASVSKQFIAAGVMLLVQDGKISPDDLVKKYIPEAPETWKDITVRHLLSHTSGIIRDISDFDPFKQIPDADAITRAFPAPLRFAPGSKWAYCNVGYYTLAEIITRVSGKPWGEFINERVFRPAGMTQTQTTNMTSLVPGRASGYSLTGKGVENGEIWIAIRPSGAFLSSVADMAKWDAALYTDSILKAETRRQMWTSVKLTDGSDAKYGYGWMVEPVGGHQRIFHDGGLPGFRTAFARYPDDKLSVVILANLDDASVPKMAAIVAGLYNAQLTPAPEKTLDDTEPEITAKVRKLIDGFIKEDPDLNLFTADIAKEINDRMKKNISWELSSSGKINAITLVEKTVRDDKRNYRYRLDYKNDSFFFTCAFDKEDKIIGFGTRD